MSGDCELSCQKTLSGEKDVHILLTFYFFKIEYIYYILLNVIGLLFLILHAWGLHREEVKTQKGG